MEATPRTRYVIGVDISTQTVSAALIAVRESASDSRPAEIAISPEWTASRPCRSEGERKSPAVWVELVRQCVLDLCNRVAETKRAEAIGVSTTFPGILAIIRKNGNAGFSFSPQAVSLYDNTEDAGLCADENSSLLAEAERETLCRMWPGNMALGLASLVALGKLNLRDAAALLPPNAAFAWQLFADSGAAAQFWKPISDFTQTAISGLYSVPELRPVPNGSARLLAARGISDGELVASLLPRPAPAWRNVVDADALPGVRALLGLPALRAVSIGAGDSPLGCLAVMPDSETVINIRGSSDSPVVLVDAPVPAAAGQRETVLHYPMPTAASPLKCVWCVVAPMLRSGRVWDWVRNLHSAGTSEDADSALESLAAAALKRRLSAPESSPVRRPPVFDTALGGERAPRWDPHARGSISGLLESHDIGDIALAALEGMSRTLRQCLELMESRYGVRRDRMLLVGGPTKNRLWNWVTGVVTGKTVLTTEFSDASLIGAALLGYASAFDGEESDYQISDRLCAVSRLCAAHPLISPQPVTAPDPDLASLEDRYRSEMKLLT